MSVLTIDTFVGYLAEEIGDVGPAPHVQFAGNPLQTHRGFRAQPSGQGDLFGVALAAFRQFGGGPPEPWQLFRHPAAGLFLVPLPPFPAIVAGAGRLGSADELEFNPAPVSAMPPAATSGAMARTSPW